MWLSSGTHQILPNVIGCRNFKDVNPLPVLFFGVCLQLHRTWVTLIFSDELKQLDKSGTLDL